MIKAVTAHLQQRAYVEAQNRILGKADRTEKVY